MIKCIIHGKIRIICRITLDQYHPSGIKALWLILVSRDDTAYDTDFAMYYSLYIKYFLAKLGFIQIDCWKHETMNVLSYMDIDVKVKWQIFKFYSHNKCCVVLSKYH
jgi:hypothetical protein